MNTIHSVIRKPALATACAVLAGLLAVAPASAGTTGATYYTCAVDISLNTNNCTDGVITATAVSGVQRVLRANLSPSYVRMDVFINVCNPTGWWSHVSDSPTTNGFGGDSGSTSHDAEAYTLDTAVQMYTMDNSRGAAFPSYRTSAVVPASGCNRVQWTVYESQLFFDDDGNPADTPLIDVLTSRGFESAPYAETDSEDPSSLDASLWYVGLNRTVGSTARTGTGTNKACFVLSTTTAPSAATLSALCP